MILLDARGLLAQVESAIEQMADVAPLINAIAVAAGQDPLYTQAEFAGVANILAKTRAAKAKIDARIAETVLPTLGD